MGQGHPHAKARGHTGRFPPELQVCPLVRPEIRLLELLSIEGKDGKIRVETFHKAPDAQVKIRVLDGDGKRTAVEEKALLRIHMEGAHPEPGGHLEITISTKDKADMLDNHRVLNDLYHELDPTRKSRTPNLALTWSTSLPSTVRVAVAV